MRKPTSNLVDKCLQSGSSLLYEAFLIDAVVAAERHLPFQRLARERRHHNLGGEGWYCQTRVSVQEIKPCYLSPIHFSATQSRNTWWQHNLQSLGFDFGHSPPPHTGLLHPEDGQVGLEATLVVSVPLGNTRERHSFEQSL